MECYVHPDRSAVGACVACGHFVCEVCRVNMQGRIYCKACLEQGAAAPPHPGRQGHAPPPRPAVGARAGTGGWKRSRTDRVFGGVCAGIAPELNIETSLLRVITALVALVTGIVPGFIAYVVLWAVLPEE